MTWTSPSRGDIYLADLPCSVEHEQCGCRPVIIIQNDVGNRNSPTTIIAPLTSKTKKLWQPTHFLIRADEKNGLRQDSVALLEQIRTVPKTNLIGKIGEVDPTDIEPALKASLGLN